MARPAAEQRVEAVERALALLEAFADGTRRLTLTALAARAGLYPSTTLRLAASLIRFGHLARDPDGAFRLGPSLLRLGALYQAGFDLAALARPALARLSDATGETAAYYVREGERRICLFRTAPDRAVLSRVDEGSALPLDRGAGGRVLAAFSGGGDPTHAEIRAAGFACSFGERDPETAAVAVPVFGARGALVGALGVTGPRSRFDPAACVRFAAALRVEATLLGRALGGG